MLNAPAPRFYHDRITASQLTGVAAPTLMRNVIFRLLANLFRLLVAPLLLLRRFRACPSGAWIAVTLEGNLDDLPAPRSLPWHRPFALRRSHPSLSLYQLGQLVTELLRDPKPIGLFVSVRNLNASAAQRSTLRELLQRVRDGGRQVVVYLPDGGSCPELAIAAGASRILMGKKTSLGPLGFRAGGWYLRRALDRAGVAPQIHAQGAYKTAGEGLMRDAMSPAQREQLDRLLDVLQSDLVTALAHNRSVTAEVVLGWLDKGLISADEAVRLTIVDATAYDDEIPQLLATAPATEATMVAASKYGSRRRARVWKRLRRRPSMAVLPIHGAIVERAVMPFGTFCEAERITQTLAALAKNRRVAGVILHIDSPGGGVLASDRIYHAVQKLAEKKPVVACFAGVAASGGYYVAAATRAIIARPTTITGSIGVVATRVVVQPLLERLGISFDRVVRGQHVDMFDPWRSFTTEEHQLFETELAHTYDDFIRLVAAGRGRSVEEILPLAGGRVWAGQDALEHGLVDQLGGLETAIEHLRTLLPHPNAAAEVETVFIAPSASSHPEPLWMPQARVLLQQWPALEPVLTRWLLAARTQERFLAYDATLAGLFCWAVISHTTFYEDV